MTTTTTTTKTTRTTKLGAAGPEVFPIGLGCMGFSGMYGATNDAESVRLIQSAIDRGVTLIDTGDFYGMGHNEMLIARALEGAGRRSKVQLSVKFGAQRGPDGSWLGFDGRPAAVKTSVAYSLKRLGVEHIDVYRPARLDPSVPIEETVGAIADLVKKGYVRHLGLSEVNADTVRRAHEVLPVADLQIEYGLATRGPEERIFPALRELGASATLYGVLSRGLLTGSKPEGEGDFRAYLPRFTGENRVKNEEAVGALASFARERGMTPGQAAIAWVLAKQPGFVPVIGARTQAQLDDLFAASEKRMTDEDVKALEGLVRVQGDRYATEQMKHLDSEKK